MKKIKLVETNAREGKSGSLEINKGYGASYDLAGDTLTLGVSMKLSDGTVGASGGATVDAPYTDEKISNALQTAALKAMNTYIQNNIKPAASDGGTSVKKVRHEMELATHKFSYERDFDSAAANIGRELGED